MILIDRRIFHFSAEYGQAGVDAQLEKYINSRDNSSHRFVSVQQISNIEFLIVWKEKL